MKWNKNNPDNKPTNLRDFDSTKVYLVWGNEGWLVASYDADNNKWTNSQHVLPNNITHWAEVTPPPNETSVKEIESYYLEKAKKLPNGETLKIKPEHEANFSKIADHISQYFTKKENGHKNVSNDPQNLEIRIYSV